MSKMTLEYTEKHHILEVDGAEYEVPQRTPEITKKLEAHDEKIGERSEYESNIDLLAILFGEENAKKMFPEGDRTNLDKLAKCTKIAMALYMADFNVIQSETLKDALKEIEPALKAVDKVSKMVKSTNTKTFVSKKHK